MYPNQQPFGSGMPMPQQNPGYPPQQPPYPGGFSQPGPNPGYPSQQAPYPGAFSQPGPNPGFPGYPPQGQAYPPQNQVYPPQGQVYPPQGFPPQGQAYPPQGQGFPSQGQAYPPQGQGFPGNYAAPNPMSFQPAAQAFGAGSHQMYPQLNMESISKQEAYSQNSSAQIPVKKGRPTVKDAPNFDAANDAAVLRKAMKGFGTDENAIISVLCHRPSHQRVEIVRAYKTAYGKDLINDIRSETSGNFEILLVALLTPTIQYYCEALNYAMTGAGTDEDVLIEVMCTMSNAEVKEIGAMYYRMYGKSLEETLRDDTSGSVKRLFTSLSVGGRDESMNTNLQSARADAEALKKAGVDRWGTDESEFNRILCLRNYEQLNLVADEYKKLTGNTLEKDIKREFSGDIEDALLAILRVANNRPEFFARRLHKSMAGMGTNDRSLIRLCITRAEIDMIDVKEEFQRYYSKSLKGFIKGDTSGHYKKALLALCGENDK